MLHVVFTLNRVMDRVVLFEIDKTSYPVSLGKAENGALPVLADPADEIAGHANEKRAVRTIGEDVDVASAHTVRFAHVDGRDKPGHDDWIQSLLLALDGWTSREKPGRDGSEAYP
jgi:hypothetical protein